MSRGYKLTQEQFIEKAKQLHGNKYDYSKTIFKRTDYKITIACPVHGEFEQLAKSHLQGNGCPKCSKTFAMSKKDFIKKANQIHNNKYDYSKVEYVNSNTKVCIICPIHGEFEQLVKSHLNGNGCKKCNIDKKFISQEQWISNAKQVHGDKYDYSLVKYKGNRFEVTIICPIHGEFKQQASSHTQGSGCFMCRNSNGEESIRKWLLNNNIIFISEYRFNDCRNKNSLPFDFAIFDQDNKLELLIEYQGIQHFKSVEYFGGKKQLDYVKENDNIKLEYCKNNGIKLIRIPYTKINNINYILCAEILCDSKKPKW